MTDKQIIDGVDVSGCEFLVKEDDYCSYSGEYRGYKGQCGCSDEEMCKDHPNCFYKKALKQLKRKEQECEELKKEIAFGNNGTLSDKIRAKVFKELNNENNQLKVENEELKKKLQADNCLTDIKEICENNDELQGDFNVVDCDKYRLGKHNLAKKITQKISECEVIND